MKGSIDLTDYQLPSGLRVIFHRDAARPTVDIVTVVGAGGSDDPAGREGLAHLVEHLTFRATHDGALSIGEVIEGIGGIFNASTSHDSTVYSTTAPKSALPGLLRIEAMRLIDPVAGLDQATLDAEREVVRNERRQRLELGVTRPLLDTLDEMLFPPDHPRRRSVIGDHDTLSAITLDDIGVFVREHYVPANTTIVVSGDIDLDHTTRFIGALPVQLVTADGRPPPPGQPLEPTPLPPRIRAEPGEPHPPTETIRRIRGPVEQPTLLVGWALPGIFSGHHTEMRVLAGATADRIRRAMRPRSRDEVSHLDELGCWLSGGVHASVMACMVVPTPGVDVEDALDEAVASWSHYSGNARRDHTYRAFHELASGGLPHRMAMHAHYTGRNDAFHHALREIEQLDRGGDFVDAWYGTERRAALLIEPDDTPPPPPTVGHDATAAWDGAVFDRSAQATDIYGRLTPAHIEALAQPPLPTIERFDLPQGLPVVLVPDPASPFVRVAFYGAGGRLSTRPPGMIDFVRTSSLAKDVAQILGTFVRRRSADGYLTGVEGPAGSLPAIVQSVATRLETLYVPYSSRGWDRLVDFTIERQRRRLRERGVRMGYDIWRRLYPDHPFAFDLHDRAPLEAVDHDDLEGFFERVVAPANGALLVVGAFDAASIRPLLIDALGDWRDDDPGHPVTPLPPPPPPVERQIVFEHDPGAPQTELRLLCRLEATPRDDMTTAVLADLLHTDLYLGVRQKTGSSYSPSARISTWAGGNTVLDVRAIVHNDHAVPAARAVIERLATLGRGGAERAALRQAQWSVARRTQRSGRTLPAMTATLTAALRTGLGVEGLATQPARLGAVDAAAFARVLAPCVGHEVIGVIGPKPVRALLAELAPTHDTFPAPAGD